MIEEMNLEHIADLLGFTAGTVLTHTKQCAQITGRDMWGLRLVEQKVDLTESVDRTFSAEAGYHIAA